MSTLTLELTVSEKIVSHWGSLPDDERRQWRDALAQALTVLDAGEDLSRILGVKFAREDDSEEWEDEAERADTRAAIAEGIADMEAGRFLTYEQFVERERSYFRVKGMDFDASLANVKLVIHDER